MPCTGRSRSRASPSPRSTSRGTIRSSWTKRPTSVQPGEALQVDEPRRRPRWWRRATTRSSAASGSWSTRARPCSQSTPVLVPRPGAEGLAKRLSQCAPEAPPRPGRHAQRLVLDHPVAARRRRRRQHPGRRAREGGTDRRANAVARIDPRRAHADDARGRSGSRRSADTRGRARRTDVQGRGSRLAHAAATHEARPLPGRHRELPRRGSTRSGWRRPSSRCSRKGGSGQSTRGSSSTASAYGSAPHGPVSPSTAGGWPTRSPQRRHRRSAAPLSA